MMLAGIRSLCAGGRAEMGYVVGPNIHAWWNRVSSRWAHVIPKYGYEDNY